MDKSIQEKISEETRIFFTFTGKEKHLSVLNSRLYSLFEAEIEKVKEELKKMKYTKDQGMDAEMESYNEGIADAMKAINSKGGAK